MTKSVVTVTHSCLPCSGRALHVASCIDPESNLSVSGMLFVFELEAIIYMQGRVGSPRALAQPL